MVLLLCYNGAVVKVGDAKMYPKFKERGVIYEERFTS